MDSEFLENNLARSKSYDDFLTIFETENDEPPFNTRKSFSRQGAFRKRIPEMEILKYKRTSLNDSSKPLNGTLGFSKDCEFPLEKEKNCQKKIKNGFSSFTLVKDMWKSLKRDNKMPEKGDMKKKSMEKHDSSNGMIGWLSEVEGSSVCMFLQGHGEKINKITDDTVLLTESSWEQLVDNPKELKKLEIERQAAIWEIIETESTFIKQLSVVTHVFYPVLQRLMVCYYSELATVDIHDMFGNIDELYLSHWTLWNNCISVPLSVTKIKRVPLDITLMKDGFCKISKILSGYIVFMRHLPAMREKIRKAQNESNIFNQYIEWSKSYCRSCRDGHNCILSLPFQRITRYKILLERVRSLSDNEQQANISDMIESVHNFLQQMNSTMVGKYSMKDIKEKIIDNGLRREHICETNKFLNEDDFRFDIMRPLSGFPERILIHEGRLRLRKCNNKTLEVHCYLCTDLLMICKSVKNNWEKMKIYKSPVRLDKLLVKEESEGSFIVIVYNDFQVVSNVMVFVADGDEVRLWIDKCNRTKSTFLNRLLGPSDTSLLQTNYTNGVISPIMEDVSIEECQRVWKCSETTSYADSTYSTDSAFSQTSSTSTQIDCSNSTCICPVTKSPSIDDLTTINEDHQDSCHITVSDSTDDLQI